ncbi:MAG: hypothetical protein WCT31_02930 [Candidatus Micrarchaeia archaeon]
MPILKYASMNPDLGSNTHFRQNTPAEKRVAESIVINRIIAILESFTPRKPIHFNELFEVVCKEFPHNGFENHPLALQVLLDADVASRNPFLRQHVNGNGFDKNHRILEPEGRLFGIAYPKIGGPEGLARKKHEPIGLDDLIPDEPELTEAKPRKPAAPKKDKKPKKGEANSAKTEPKKDEPSAPAQVQEHKKRQGNGKLIATRTIELITTNPEIYLEEVIEKLQAKFPDNAITEANIRTCLYKHARSESQGIHFHKRPKPPKEKPPKPKQATNNDIAARLYAIHIAEPELKLEDIVEKYLQKEFPERTFTWLGLRQLISRKIRPDHPDVCIKSRPNQGPYTRKEEGRKNIPYGTGPKIAAIGIEILRAAPETCAEDIIGQLPSELRPDLITPNSLRGLIITYRSEADSNVILHLRPKEKQLPQPDNPAIGSSNDSSQ